MSMKNLKIGTRLGIGFAAMLVLMALLAATGMLRLARRATGRASSRHRRSRPAAPGSARADRVRTARARSAWPASSARRRPHPAAPARAPAGAGRGSRRRPASPAGTARSPAAAWVPAQQVGQPAVQRDHHGGSEQVGGEDPRQRPSAREFARHHRQCGRQDGLVERGQDQGQDEHGEGPQGGRLGLHGNRFRSGGAPVSAATSILYSAMN